MAIQLDIACYIHTFCLLSFQPPKATGVETLIFGSINILHTVLIFVFV